MKKEIDTRYVAVCEDLGWSVYISDCGDIDLRIASPAGEYFIVGVEADGFIEKLRWQADNFDEDEHVLLNAGQRGAPPIRELCEDAEKIHEMLNELADALEEAAHADSTADADDE